MNSDSMIWRGIEKVDLLAELIGFRQNEKMDSSRYSTFDSCAGEKIKIGFPASSALRQCPVMVVQDDYIDELFAWLYTFAEEAMPLSVHCKIVVESDMDIVKEYRMVPSRSPFRKWASMIAGEMMLRSGSDEVIADASTSWVLLSFSFPASLAFNCFGKDTRLLQDTLGCRLRRASHDSVAKGNDVNFEHLETFWEICNRAESFPHLPKEAIVFTFKRLMKIAERRGTWSSDRENLYHQFQDVIYSPEFDSDSMESRVLAFDKSVVKLRRFNSEDSLIGAFGVAAAAFLVGRGTSHVHLLNGQENKLAYLWFSLFAGLCGDVCWDPGWLILTKRIEALAEFYAPQSQFASTLSDLSWAEFDWILKGRESSGMLRALPKIVQNMITVEIIPNIPVQIRLGRSVREGVQAGYQIPKVLDSDESIARRLEELALQLRGRRDKSFHPEQYQMKLEDASGTVPKRGVKRGKK